MMIGMKISVNTPEELVRFVDSQVNAGHYPSRSAAFTDALTRWRVGRLESSYDQAFSNLDPAWDEVEADGLLDEER